MGTDPVAMIAYSKLTLLFLFLPVLTVNVLFEVNDAYPCIYSIFLDFVSSFNPPVSFLTTSSFQLNNLRTLILGGL